ncbi:Uncharacterised protein [Acinetobacter baumannii]|nr:Uncharacterised protein [Acinetobacter baumannii]
MTPSRNAPSEYAKCSISNTSKTAYKIANPAGKTARRSSLSPSKSISEIFLNLSNLSLSL